MGLRALGKKMALRPLTPEDTQEGLLLKADIGLPKDDVRCEVMGVGALCRNGTEVGATVLIPRTLNYDKGAALIIIDEDDVLCEIEA